MSSLDEVITDDPELLGISAAEPEFACVRVAPNPVAAGKVEGKVAIPAGFVSVNWIKQPGNFRLEVSVPIGTHLQVRLPALPTDSLFVDGEPIADDTQTLRSSQFVELAVLPGNNYIFEVLSPQPAGTD